MEEDASTSGNTNISPQLLNEWIEIQDSLKKRLTIEDEFDWKLPPMKDQDSEGIEENQDSSGEILKYVGGVDLSFSRNDSLIACATLVVLDISTLEVVHEDSSIIKLRIPYVPGFLAFREQIPTSKQCSLLFHVEFLRCIVLLVFWRAFFYFRLWLMKGTSASRTSKEMKKTSPTLYPQVLMVDGNGLLHPRGKSFFNLLKRIRRDILCAFILVSFGLACHLGVLADLPTIGIGKNLHQVDGLTQSRVRRVLEANGNPRSDIFTLIGDSGSTLGAAMRTTKGSLKPIFISVGHRVSLPSAIKIVKLFGRFRVPEPIRQVNF
ncbi:Endonuclease V [Sesamum angolense]|uniref:Endonuclease V n=1 Tax=Sesamum angolense TaxID=2727404 RepID=A0AAE1W956_9LAMI|nr:Endonuclease V [Sesamum angolense]